ncbi:MAG: TIGR04086 family membrane protein [Candidatus Omnitrophota bacterium]
MGSERPIKIKALALGILAYIGGSLVFGSILGLAMGIILTAQGVSANEMNARIWGPILNLINGFGSAVLGGFVAGRIAKQKQVLHGAIVGAIVVVTWIILGFFSGESFPLAWHNIVLFVGVVPFGMLGGRVAENTRKKINDMSSNRSTITENKELNKQSEIAPSLISALLVFGAGVVALILLSISGMAGINTAYGFIPVAEVLGAISCCVASYLNRKYWFLLGALFAFPIIVFSIQAILTNPGSDPIGFWFLITASAICLASGIAGSLIGVIIGNNIRKKNK